ncbi:MAG: hypothetical protein WBD16_00750 [Pyrinomonadaceae bacterium]
MKILFIQNIKLRTIFVIGFFLFTIHDLPFTAYGQRDYFTDAEIELIRDAQQIDQRVNILTHAIDRRFGVLRINVSEPSKKPSGEWGELPTGTRLELFADIKYILRKAIEDIDNLAERPDSFVVDQNEKKPKGYSELFPKAVRHLATAAERYRPIFKIELDKSTTEVEKGVLLDTLEMCDEIIASVAKLPAVVKKSN